MSWTKLTPPPPDPPGHTPFPVKTDLPEGWVVVRAEEVIEINPRKPEVDVLPADALVTFVPMAAVDECSGTITASEDRPFGQLRSKSYTPFAEGDVLLAKITPCMENGKAALAYNLTNKLGFGSTEFHVFRSMGTVLPEYLYHYIRQQSFRDDAQIHMTGTAGQLRVPADYVKRFELPLAPLTEQKRIVAKVEALLERVNAARARLARLPALLKRFRQSVLAAACSGRLTETWRLSHTVSESASELIERIAASRPAGARVFDSDIPLAEGLPDGWARTTIGFLAEPTLNGRPYVTSGSRGWARYVSDRGPYFIRSENINTDTLQIEEAVKVAAPAGAEADRTRVIYADLLLTITGNNVGRTAVVPIEVPEAHVSQHVAIIRTTRLSDVHYLWLWLRSGNHGQSQLEERFYGETKPGLNLNQVKSFWVDLPPLDEQREIVRRVEALFALADGIEAHVRAATVRAERLPQAILARAFRGELVPTEADLAAQEGRDYEPASALLERIRESRKPPEPARRGLSSEKRPRRSGVKASPQPPATL